MNDENNEGQPLVLILARNLVSIISLAAVLVDAEGGCLAADNASVVGAHSITREAFGSAEYGRLCP